MVDDLPAQVRADHARHVEAQGAGRFVGQQFEHLHQDVDQVGAARCVLLQRGNVDVGRAHHVTPVTHGQAGVPLVVGAEAFVATASGVGKGFLLGIADLQAADTAFREDAVHGGIAPSDQPHRGVGRAGAPTVDDVVTVLGRQRVEARRQAGDLLRVDRGVAVDQLGGHGLRQAFEEGDVLRHQQAFLVVGDIHQRLIDLGIGFEHAGLVADLYGGAFLGLHAVVQFAPGARRQAGADRGFVAGAIVARHPRDVVEHLVAQRDDLDDRGNLLAGIGAFLALGQVGEGQGNTGKQCHCLSPRSVSF
ncbi:hypothetical protein D9M70_479710 [compost metagenome]